MVNSKMTDLEFAQKIDYEGGVMSALEYGLIPSDVEPGKMRALWSDIYNEWSNMSGKQGEIYRYIDHLFYDEDDE